MKFGLEIPGPGATIIGDIPPHKPSWALYSGEKCVKGRAEAGSAAECRKLAKDYFDKSGGRKTWPAGLELRIWD